MFDAPVDDAHDALQSIHRGIGDLSLATADLSWFEGFIQHYFLYNEKIDIDGLAAHVKWLLGLRGNFELPKFRQKAQECLAELEKKQEEFARDKDSIKSTILPFADLIRQQDVTMRLLKDYEEAISGSKKTLARSQKTWETTRDTQCAGFNK